MICLNNWDKLLSLILSFCLSEHNGSAKAANDQRPLPTHSDAVD